MPLWHSPCSRNQIAWCCTDAHECIDLPLAHGSALVVTVRCYPLFINLIIKWVFPVSVFDIFSIMSLACSGSRLLSHYPLFTTLSIWYEFLFGCHKYRHTAMGKTFAGHPINMKYWSTRHLFHGRTKTKQRNKLNGEAPPTKTKWSGGKWNVSTATLKVKRREERKKRNGHPKWITVIDTLLKINWKKNWIHSIIRSIFFCFVSVVVAGLVGV